MSQSRAQLSDEKRKIKIVMEKENKKKEKWYNQKKQYLFFGWGGNNRMTIKLYVSQLFLGKKNVT